MEAKASLIIPTQWESDVLMRALLQSFKNETCHLLLLLTGMLYWPVDTLGISVLLCMEDLYSHVSVVGAISLV